MDLRLTSNAAVAPKDCNPYGLCRFGCLALLLLGHRALRLCSLVAPRHTAKAAQREPSLFMRWVLVTLRERSTAFVGRMPCPSAKTASRPNWISRWSERLPVRKDRAPSPFPSFCPCGSTFCPISRFAFRTAPFSIFHPRPASLPPSPIVLSELMRTFAVFRPFFIGRFCTSRTTNHLRHQKRAAAAT